MPNKLDKEQQKAFNLVLKEHKGIFLTGDAGTGKTFTLKRICEAAEVQNMQVFVLASTGIAAKNADGETLHHFLRISPSADLIQTNSIEYKISMRNTVNHLHRIFKDCMENNIYRVLIAIDEISMCRADLFDFMNEAVQKAQQYTVSDIVILGKSFDVQYLLIGDFFQLPPVTTTTKNKKDNESEKDILEKRYPGKSPYYAFLSGYWSRAVNQTVILHQLHRQASTNKNNVKFKKALTAIRSGYGLNEENKSKCNNGINIINQLASHTYDPNAVTLCGLNRKANAINQGSLNKLASNQILFKAYVDKHLKNNDYDVDTNITLAKGAKIIMTANGNGIDVENNDPDTNVESFANGTRGIIEDIKIPDQVVIDNRLKDNPVKQPNGTIKAPKEDFAAYDGADYYKQLHKLAQQMSIIIKFKDGKTLAVTWNAWNIYAYKKLKKHKKGEPLFKKQRIGYINMIPIRPSYAITVHKSQGLTLPAINFDPKDAFASGMCYVALSRVKSVKGLHLISNLKFDNLQVNSDVIRFYNKDKHDFINSNFQNITVDKSSMPLIKLIANFKKPQDKQKMRYFLEQYLVFEQNHDAKANKKAFNELQSIFSNAKWDNKEYAKKDIKANQIKQDFLNFEYTDKTKKDKENLINKIRENL